MIRLDAMWPQDMRVGAERLLNVVVNSVGCARAHHRSLVANARASRIKLLVWSVPDGGALRLVHRDANGARWGCASLHGLKPSGAPPLPSVAHSCRCPLQGVKGLRVPRSDRKLQIWVLRTGRSGAPANSRDRTYEAPPISAGF